MKKVYFVIVSLLFLVGCENGIIYENYAGDKLSITARIDGGSRTAFVEDDGVVKVEWEEDETSGVLLYAENGKSHALYRIVKNEDGTAALLPYNSHQVVKAHEGERIYA